MPGLVVIDRVECELSASSREHAERAQELTARAVAELGRLLEAATDADGPVLRFDTIEIDLGRVGLARLDRELARRVSAAILTAVDEARGDVRRGSDTVRITAIGSAPPRRDVPTLSGARAAVDPRLEPVEALLFFLVRGVLPWWFPDERRSELACISVSDGPIAVRERLTAELPRALLAAPAALERLERHAPALRFTALLEPPVLARMRPALERAEHPERVARLVWLIRHALGVDAPEATALPLVRRLVSALSPSDRRLVAEATFANALDAIAPGAHARVLRGLEALREASPSAPPPPGHETRPKPSVAASVTPLPPSPPALQREPATTVRSEPDASEEAGVAVRDAGLVLLHPFLPRFFARLGLTDARGQLLADARDRAVHLLYFLAHGACSTFEPDLALEKVLCGLSMDEPVGPAPVDESACREAESLLAAAIDHWSALRTTSPDGLRGAFLRRDGRLSLSERTAMLVIERRAYDVLLGRLPWGLSKVRLPWMPWLLEVNWPPATA